LHTELEEIDGIGPRTAKKLLREFGSVKRIKEASEDDLKTAIGTHLAKKVLGHFNS
jgi:excinuclease ABC subunit C